MFSVGSYTNVDEKWKRYVDASDVMRSRQSCTAAHQEKSNKKKGRILLFLLYLLPSLCPRFGELGSFCSTARPDEGKHRCVRVLRVLPLSNHIGRRGRDDLKRLHPDISFPLSCLPPLRFSSIVVSLSLSSRCCCKPDASYYAKGICQNEGRKRTKRSGLRCSGRWRHFSNLHINCNQHPNSDGSCQWFNGENQKEDPLSLRKKWKIY